MTKLCDRSIRHQMYAGRLSFTVPPGAPPIEDSQFQSASVDLRLGEIGSRIGELFGLRRAKQGVLLEPHIFLLGSTIETVGLPTNLVGAFKGKSTNARNGLKVECAGHIDPGFTGELTVELFNMSDESVLLEYGMRIGQIVLDWLDGDAERPYGHESTDNHYQGQTGPTPAWR